MDFSETELKQHIEHKIHNADIVHFPFPHLIIENFFPEDIYEHILSDNPFKYNTGKEWINKGRSEKLKTGTPYSARKQINFHANIQLNMDPDAIEFWNNLKKIFLNDNWFEKLVLSKYREYFIIRFGEIVNNDKFFSFFRKELFLQQHDMGYFIGPHTDIPTRVFTCIFSFADKPGYEEYGTEICVPKNPRIRCWGNNHYSPENFIIKKVAPYKPNNFLLFFKTRQSFHSVRLIDKDVPNKRYGMQFQLYEPPGGIFKDLSEPDLLVTKHNKEAVK